MAIFNSKLFSSQRLVVGISNLHRVTIHPQLDNLQSLLSWEVEVLAGAIVGEGCLHLSSDRRKSGSEVLERCAKLRGNCSPFNSSTQNDLLRKLEIQHDSTSCNSSMFFPTPKLPKRLSASWSDLSGCRPDLRAPATSMPLAK